MNKVKIIVDSTVDLTKELLKEIDADVVPLSVNFGNDVYKDGIDITSEEIFKRVDKEGNLPSTAAPSPEDFEKVFKKYVNEGYDVVYLGIGSKLSSTLQNAFIASQMLEEGRVFLVDSNNLSTGSGLLAMKAHEMAKNGLSAKEIAAKLEELSKKVVAQFVVDKLDYLHKGGRCSGASKLFGHLFHIHPVIRVIDGELIVYKKARGLIKVGITEQLNDMKADMPLDESIVFVTHSPCDKALADYAVEEVKKILPNSRVEETVAGSVISSHCGPNTLGILYIKK